MKRHPSLIPYSQDHHKILLLAQVLKKDVPDYKGMPTDLQGKIEMTQRYFKDIIRPHEDKEEEFLFPMIKGKDKEVDQLIQSLEEEHDLMGQMLKDLDPRNSSENDLDQLGIALEKHVRKEERVLFQMVQEKIGEDLLRQIRY